MIISVETLNKCKLKWIYILLCFFFFFQSLKWANDELASFQVVCDFSNLNPLIMEAVIVSKVTTGSADCVTDIPVLDRVVD